MLKRPWTIPAWATWPALGVALAMAAVGLFLALADEVSGADTEAFDADVLRWLATHRTPGLSQLFGAITHLGSWEFVSASTVVLFVAGLFTGHKRAAATLVASVLGILPLVVLLKPLYARPRPGMVSHLAVVDSASFPSGHALAATVFFGTLSLLIAGRFSGHATRAAIVGAAVALASLVAFSRMYLGVHYPTDVFGGALVGGAWLLSIVVLAGKLFK